MTPEDEALWELAMAARPGPCCDLAHRGHRSGCSGDPGPAYLRLRVDVILDLLKRLADAETERDLYAQQVPWRT